MSPSKITVLAATAAVALAGIAPAASDAKATTTGKHKIIEQTYIKKEAGKIFTGTMKPGWTFKVERLSPSGKYAYGMAYGHVNRHGWVEAAALAKKK